MLLRILFNLPTSSSQVDAELDLKYLPSGFATPLSRRCGIATAMDELDWESIGDEVEKQTSKYAFERHLLPSSTASTASSVAQSTRFKSGLLLPPPPSQSSFIASNSFYESPNKENFYLGTHATPGNMNDYNDLKNTVLQQGKKITIMERMFQSYNELMVRM